MVKAYILLKEGDKGVRAEMYAVISGKQLGTTVMMKYRSQAVSFLMNIHDGVEPCEVVLLDNQYRVVNMPGFANPTPRELLLVVGTIKSASLAYQDRHRRR